MPDVTKLPKWAQNYIDELERSQNQTHITNCSVENNAVRHDEHSADAIRDVARALEQNASALGELAKSLSGRGVEVSFGPGISIQSGQSRS